MRRLLTLMLAALLLLLSACGGTEAAAPTPEPTLTPSPTPTRALPPVSGSDIPMPTPTMRQQPPMKEPPKEYSGVYTDWSFLTDYEPPTEICSRLTEAPMETLVPSDSYGRLLPFDGARLQTAYWGEYSMRGLVTTEGLIVMDAVCTELYQCYRWNYPSQSEEPAPFYRMSKVVAAPDAEMGAERRFAVCALDGSWATDFIYEEVACCELGAACFTDTERNQLVLLNERGEKIFDTADCPLFAEQEQYTSLYSELSSGGKLLLHFRENKVSVRCYVELTGEILTPEGTDGRFVGAGSFSEGLAAVSDDGELWGYMDDEGNWALPPAYLEAQCFYDGQAAVRREDGSWAVIDREGGTVFESEYPLRSEYRGGKVYYAYRFTAGDDPCQFLNENFEPLSKARSGWWLCEEGPTLVAKGGVLLYPGGGEPVLLRDAASVARCVNGLLMMNLQNGGVALMDTGGEVLQAFPRGDCRLISDGATGECYLLRGNGNNSYDLLSVEGETLATDVSFTNTVYNGLLPASDALSAGYKNLEGEWVFRVILGAPD